MTSRVVFGIAALAASVSSFGLASGARAQASIHTFDVSVKAVSQGTTTGGDMTPAKAAVRTADVFAACVGTPPTKTQRLSLAIACDDLNDNLIDAVDGPNLDVVVLGGIGALTFDLDHAVYKTSNAGLLLKSASIPVLISIECVAPDASLAWNRIADLTFKPFEATVCPETVKVRITGIGMTGALPAFLTNDGSSAHSKRVINMAM